MRATLWQDTSEASALIGELLRGAVFGLAGVPLDIVHSARELLAAARRAEQLAETHALVIDCYEGTPEDLERCADIITRTQAPLWIVHPQEQSVRDLQTLAGRTLGWLSAEATIPMLLQLHATLRTMAAVEAKEPAPPALTAREREVMALAIEGRTNAEIAAALAIGEGTAKTHVRHCMEKYGVSSRRALRQAARAGRGGTEAANGHAPPEPSAARQ